jgi:hypothetical protein
MSVLYTFPEGQQVELAALSRQYYRHKYPKRDQEPVGVVVCHAVRRENTIRVHIHRPPTPINTAVGCGRPKTRTASSCCAKPSLIPIPSSYERNLTRIRHQSPRRACPDARTRWSH